MLLLGLVGVLSRRDSWRRSLVKFSVSCYKIHRTRHMNCVAWTTYDETLEVVSASTFVADVVQRQCEC